MSHNNGPLESAKSMYGVMPSIHALPAVKNHAESSRIVHKCVKKESGERNVKRKKENKKSTNQ